MYQKECFFFSSKSPETESKNIMSPDFKHLSYEQVEINDISLSHSKKFV